MEVLKSFRRWKSLPCSGPVLPAFGLAVVLMVAVHVGVAAGATQNFYSEIFHELMVSTSRGVQLYFLMAGFYAMGVWADLETSGERRSRDFLVLSMAGLLPAWWLAVVFYGYQNGEQASDMLIAGSMVFGLARYVFHDVVGDGWLIFSVFVYWASFPLVAAKIRTWRQALWLVVAGYVVWRVWYAVAAYFQLPGVNDYGFLFPLSHYFAFGAGVLLWHCKKAGFLDVVAGKKEALFALDVVIPVLFWELATNRYNHFLGLVPFAAVVFAMFVGSPVFGRLAQSRALEVFGRYSLVIFLTHIYVLNAVAGMFPAYLPEGFIYLPAEVRIFVYTPFVIVGCLALAWLLEFMWVAPFRRLAAWWVARCHGTHTPLDIFGGADQVLFGHVRQAIEWARTRSYTEGLYWVLLFMFFGAVFDPMGKLYHIKQLSFAVLVLFAAYSVFSRRLRDVSGPYLAFWVLFSLLVPGFGLVRTYMNSGSLSFGGESVYLTAGLFLGYALLLKGAGCVEKALDALDRVLMLMVWGVLIGAGLLLLKSGSPFLGFLWDHYIASPGFREYGGFKVVNVYFYSAPMLMLPLARRWVEYFDSPDRRKFLLAGACSLALVLTGTRACMILGLVAPALVWVWIRLGLIRTLFLLGALAVGFVALGTLLGSVGAMLSANEESNAIKLGYLQYYVQLFSVRDVLLFGQGFNAASWSEVFREMLSGSSKTTELTYLEIFRVYGVIVGGMLMLLLLAPVFLWQRYAHSWRYCAIGWFFFLVLSMSNPYIMSSTGMSLLGVVSAALVLSVWPVRNERPRSLPEEANEVFRAECA